MDVTVESKVTKLDIVSWGAFMVMATTAIIVPISLPEISKYSKCPIRIAFAGDPIIEPIPPILAPYTIERISEMFNNCELFAL